MGQETRVHRTLYDGQRCMTTKVKNKNRDERDIIVQLFVKQIVTNYDLS